ncbi:diguanylate cyclase (GGDEF) domain-containing protein [Eubacterium ruminantium]|nr:diguanylate cyclase (GGDEF) domain-containing protein [Eubacterium ruminantium]
MKQFQLNYTDDESFRGKMRDFSVICKKAGLSKVIIQILSEELVEELIKRVGDIINSEMPEAEIIGCSSSGNLINANVSDSRVTVVATVFERPTTQFKVLQYAFTQDSYENVAKELEKEVAENSWVKAIELYFCIPGFSTTPFCDKLVGLPADIQIFGGIACSDDISSPDSFVYSKKYGYKEHDILIIMYGGEDFYASSLYLTGWQPLGKKYRIMKSDGNTLYYLDNFKAYEIYRKYLKIKNDENFFINALEFPLLYKKDGIDILRVPAASNADGSIEMSGDMAEGSVVRMGYGNPSTILEICREQSKKIKEFRPDMIHIFSCAARKTFWVTNENAVRELKPFGDIAASSGFFTHGEFIRVGGHLNQHNVTLVIAAMREGEPDEFSQFYTFAEEEKSDKIPMTVRLANFVSVVTGDLEEANQKLEEANAELARLNERSNYYAIHDGMTKLLNRSETQRRIEGRYGFYKDDPVDSKGFTLIMMDIDNFKHINDTYGHHSGDEVIIKLAELLREISVSIPHSFVGRWGGEEFMFFVPGTYESFAKMQAEKIRTGFNSIEFSDVPSQTISLGIAMVERGEPLDKLLTRVDQALYKAKNSGKNRVEISGMNDATDVLIGDFE